VEFEDREPDQGLLTALESFRPSALGGAGANWGAAVEAELIVNLGKYRRYDYTSLRDLLRVVRNKKNHFREMPEPLQRAMGPVPDGYYRRAAFGGRGQGRRGASAGWGEALALTRKVPPCTCEQGACAASSLPVWLC
jgi:hypothetical protein